MEINPFRTIEQKLEDEVKYAFRDRKFSQRQFEKLMDEQRKVYLIPKEKMTFIIAHCIYNEADFFKQCLEDDLKMNDVDMIHILDGAWYEGGNAQSTDGTLAIIEEFKARAKEIGVEVIYEYKGIWKNESEKRNYQLDRINQLIDTPHYILIKDGDEFFHFLSGRQNLWVKRDMVEWMKTPNDVGLLNAHAWYFDQDMLSARFFPSTNRVHYYSERPMVIHDKSHNLIMDYNRETLRIDRNRCFRFGSFMLINWWNLRNDERIFIKQKYLDATIRPDDCKYGIM